MPEITPDQITAGFAAAEGGGNAPEPAQAAAPAPQQGATPPVAPAAPETASYPWAKDVEGLGLPPEMLPKLNEYLANNWQPRMTEFETKNKGYLDQFGGNEDHMALMSQMYQEFSTDPEQAFRKMGVDMGYLDPADFEDGQLGSPDAPQGDPQAPQNALPPEYQQWMDEKMAKEAEEKQLSQLNEYFDGVGQKFGDNFDRDLYHQLFVGTLGNEEQALATYQKYQDAIAAGQPPAAAPQVLNDGTGGAPLPTSGQPKTIDDAMALFVQQEEAAKRAR